MPKKLLIILLTILLSYFLGTGPTAIAATSSTSTLYAILDEQAQALLPGVSSFCWSSQTGLYFLDATAKPSLFHWVQGTHEIELIAEDPLAPLGKWKALLQEKSTYPLDEAIVFSLDDGLYSLVLATGEIQRYDVSTNEWIHIGMLNAEGIATLNAATIKDIVRDGEHMFFLIRSLNSTALLQLMLPTGKCQLLPNSDFTAIEPYSSGRLLVSIEGALHIYDPQTQTLDNTHVTADASSTAFAYDQTKDCLFFIRDGDIYRKVKNQPEELIRITEIRNETPSWDEDIQNIHNNAPVSFLLPLADGALAYHTGKLAYESLDGNPYSFIYVIGDEPIVSAIETLHVQGVPSVGTAFYQLTHPNVRIEHCPKTSEKQPQESDHFPDVLSSFSKANQSNQLNTAELIDLSKSPAISEIISHYDQKIVDAITKEGKAIGLPWSVSFGILDYDKAKWDAIGLPDPPQTVDELFELAQLWNTKYANQYPNQSLFGNGAFLDSRYGVWATVTEAYIAEHASIDASVNFDTPEYRTLIQRIIDMPEVKYDEWGALLRFFMAYSPLHYPFTQLDWKDGYTEEYTNLPPLTLTDAQPLRVNATLHYLCIPQNTPSPELALDYVTFLATFQSTFQPEIAFMMTGGEEDTLTTVINNPSFPPLPFIGLTSEGLRTLPHETPGGQISHETLSFYRRIFPALDFSIPSINPAYGWDEQAIPLPWPNDDYYGDTVCTVDELIERMNMMSGYSFYSNVN